MTSAMKFNWKNIFGLKRRLIKDGSFRVQQEALKLEETRIVSSSSLDNLYKTVNNMVKDSAYRIQFKYKPASRYFADQAVMMFDVISVGTTAKPICIELNGLDITKLTITDKHVYTDKLDARLDEQNFVKKVYELIRNEHEKRYPGAIQGLIDQVMNLPRNNDDLFNFGQTKGKINKTVNEGKASYTL